MSEDQWKMNEETENHIISTTCTAPVNIAVVKYWGKRDEELILPVNSSLSATLHQDQLCAKTTVAASKSFTQDRMWLNGVEQSVSSARLQNVFRQMRAMCVKRKRTDYKESGPSKEWNIHICSENNFPTAAGLASSAAGYACLVFTLSKLYCISGDISAVARQGSGSACRSVLGGFVAWYMGTKSDGSDSLAEQIAAAEHWPEMRILILVVNTGKKHTGSTSGMQTSVETSELLQERIKQVPRRMELMTKAILQKDYQLFAELTMKDSNQMHAVCLDTYPPISYMTDVSRDIQRLCHGVNKFFGENRVAYTYDAGPNACLYLLEKDVPLIMSLVRHFYSPENGKDSFTRGPEIPFIEISQGLIEAINIPVEVDAIKYVIHTKVGPGPQVVTDPEQSLLNESGFPKTCQ